MTQHKTELQVWAEDLKVRLEELVKGFDRSIEDLRNPNSNWTGRERHMNRAIAKKELAENILKHINSTVDL